MVVGQDGSRTGITTYLRGLWRHWRAALAATGSGRGPEAEAEASLYRVQNTIKLMVGWWDVGSEMLLVDRFSPT